MGFSVRNKSTHELSLSWIVFELDSKIILDMIYKRTTQISFLQSFLQEILALL